MAGNGRSRHRLGAHFRILSMELLVLTLMFAVLPVSAQEGADRASEEGLIDFVESAFVPPSNDILLAAENEPGVALWNEEPPEAPVGSYVPDPPWHRHLADKYGVSIDAAARIAEWQSIAMLQATDALHDKFGDQIINFRVHPSTSTIEVFTYLDEPTILAFTSEIALASPTTIEVRSNSVSAEQVTELQVRLRDRLSAAGITSTSAVIPNGLKVYVTDVEAAEVVVGSISAPELAVIQIVEYEDVVEQTHIDPRGGWTDRKAYGVTQTGCTLGFAATLDNGTAGIVSAGHCPESSGTRRLATGPDYIGSSSCLTLRRQLQYYDDPNNPELDVQFLRDEPGAAGNCFGSFFDDVCSNAWLDQTSGDFDFWRCNAYLDFTGWSSTNPEGADVILFGAFGGNGIQYGEIHNNTFPACIGCPAVYVEVYYTSNTSGGDSGGAVRIGSTIQGVHKGAFPGELWRGVYSKVRYFGDYGMTPAVSGPIGPNGS